MTELEIKKRKLGQYFTTKDLWLRPQIVEFIVATNATVAFDPFAGDGHLLEVAKELGIEETKGLDVDSSLLWEVNDSLVGIPKVEKSIIITNPPYLTNFSAKRKRIHKEVEKYFQANKNCVDLYQIALRKCLENNEFVVAIVPETFINSNFPKARLSQITILEENPFEDTECPVCVACFDNKAKSLNDIRIYKNDEFIGTLGFFEGQKIKPNNLLKIKFNTPKGKIAIRAVDMQNVDKKIEFLHINNLDYSISKVRESSRLVTVVEIDSIPEEKLEEFISICNLRLEDLREKTQDVIFSPFKGNNKIGERRRRLDYLTARAIFEDTYCKLFKESIKQGRLFNE